MTPIDGRRHPKGDAWGKKLSKKRGCLSVLIPTIPGRAAPLHGRRVAGRPRLYLNPGGAAGAGGEDGMTAIVVTIALIIGYFWLGWRIAMRRRALAWARARREWNGKYAHETVMGSFLLALFLWPIYLPWIATADRISGVVEAGDPVLLQQRIDELEQELGIR